MIEQELKARSFRITEETAEKFKEIAGQIGGNQQKALAKLIETYEMQAGKAVLPEKAGQIEDFERYTTCLNRMFMGVLEDNQNLYATIRKEFEVQLKSKDMIIANLQEEIESLKEAKKDFEKVKSEKEQLEKDFIALQETKENLSTLCNTLSKQLTESETSGVCETKLKELELKYKEEIVALKEKHLKEITECQKEITKRQKEIAEYQANTREHLQVTQ